MNRIRVLLLLAAALVLGACASMMGGAPVEVKDGALANPAGMTLYTFDSDVAGFGKSVCNGPCAVNWPPLYADADAKASGDYSIVTRDDGRKQWAYKGKPLYLWINDKKPGDRTGDGFRNVWRVAKP